MFFKIEKGEIVDRRDKPATDDGTWLSVSIVDRPAFDPATQKETPQISILADRVEIRYTISPNVVDTAALDLATLNAALAEPGSVVRALALVLLQEINTLRQKAGLATYSPQQLVAALQAKMRP